MPQTDVRTDFAELGERQSHANRLADNDLARAFEYLVEQFRKDFDAFPQYADWTDDLVLVRFNRTVRARSGYLMWSIGDVAISTRYESSYFGQAGWQTAFAQRLGWHVSVGSEYPTVLFDPKAQP